MRIFKGMGDYFALDIGTKSIRAVQLARQGDDSWSLLHVGYASVDAQTVASDSEEARRKLGQAIQSVVAQAGIGATNCVLGLESSKTFTTMVQLPKMSESDRAGTLKYQADKYIPMPLDDAKIDWAVLGDSPEDPAQDEVLLASVTQEYVENLVDMVDSLGFNVIAAEPSPIAMLRAVVPATAKGGCMVIDIGERSTDVVITIDGSPRLVRTLPTGFQMMVRTITQAMNAKDEQAQQFLLKFGLEKEKLEGQVYQALDVTLENFIAELTKSIKFLQTKYPAVTVESINVVGYAATIPLLAEFVAERLATPVQVTSPWQKVAIPDTERERMAAVEYEFATAVGLAQRVLK